MGAGRNNFQKGDALPPVAHQTARAKDVLSKFVRDCSGESTSTVGPPTITGWSARAGPGTWGRMRRIYGAAGTRRNFEAAARKLASQGTPGALGGECSIARIHA